MRLSKLLFLLCFMAQCCGRSESPESVKEVLVSQNLNRETKSFLDYCRDPNSSKEIKQMIELLKGDHDNCQDTYDSLAQKKILDLSFRNTLSDLRPLASLKNLEEVYLSANNISDISPLSNLKRLRVVFLSGNRIVDLSPLASLERLTSVHVDYNKIVDLSPISHLENLTWLDFSRNNISDISMLSNMKNLTRVYFGDNQISDISPLSSLKNLKMLIAVGNKISSTKALRDLHLLELVFLENNPLGTTVSPTEDNCPTIGVSKGLADSCSSLRESFQEKSNLIK